MRMRSSKVRLHFSHHGMMDLLRLTLNKSPISIVRRHKGGVGTTALGFSAAFLWLAQRRRGRWLSVADQRRQSDTQGPGHGAARSRVAQQVDLAVLLDFDFAQPFEILHDVGPFEVVAGRDQPVLELLAEDQSKEREKRPDCDG